MPRVPLECILMLGYAVSLGLIALVLEWVAHHAHRRTLGLSTAGFTYHPEQDIWRCPEDQRLLPVFSDSVRRTVTYRAPAAACNACPSKAACTDSSQGREIERSNLSGLEYGIKRFHRAGVADAPRTGQPDSGCRAGPHQQSLSKNCAGSNPDGLLRADSTPFGEALPE